MLEIIYTRLLILFIYRDLLGISILSMVGTYYKILARFIANVVLEQTYY